MQSKILSTILSILLALVLSNCAAIQYPDVVNAVDPSTTIRGMQMAVNGLPGTYILQQGSNLVLGWPMGSKYAWVAFSESGQLIDTLKNLCGNRACPEAAGDVYNSLINDGWKDLPVGALPPAIASTVRQFAYLLSIGASLPVLPVLIMPIQLDPIKMINPTVTA